MKNTISRPGTFTGFFGRTAVVFVVIFATVVALFHKGFLSGLWPIRARFADANGNLNYIGLTPAFNGATPWRYTYDQLPSLDGKVAFITGANSGLGFWTALHLARKGAKVYVGCRNEGKCAKAVEDMKSEIERREGAGGTTELHEAILDTSSIASVKAFCAKFLKETTRLDILVLNAGIGTSTATRSVDGIEPVFATNHVGHQLLYMMLEDLIVRTSEETRDARVVVVSSNAHYESFDDGVALTREELNNRWDLHKKNEFDLNHAKMYPQSKLANILFAQEAALRNRDNRVFVNSLHPGVVSTEIYEKMKKVWN